jgi:hypothetical protein
MALPTLPLTGRPLADVSVYSVQRRSGERHKRPWITRWSADGRQRSRSFRTKSEAERFRSGLLVAVQSGEAFDSETGEPMSWQPFPDQMRAHEWARRWLAEQWPEWAPRTRVSAVEAFARLVPLLAAPTAPEPPAAIRAHHGARSWACEVGQAGRRIRIGTMVDAAVLLGHEPPLPVVKRVRQYAALVVRS